MEEELKVLEVELLEKTVEVFSGESDKEKLLRLGSVMNDVIWCIMKVNELDVSEVPQNIPQLITYFKSKNLGEFIPRISVGFENEPILTEDLKCVSQATKTIFNKFKTAQF